jgi:anti-anti-sigma factor
VSSFQVLLSEPSATTLVLNLSGELDLGTVPPLRDASQAATGSGDHRHLIFDLTDLEFMDSTGLHEIVKAHHAMLAAGGLVTVVCSSRNLLRVFELTGLVGVLTIVHDRAEALARTAVPA